MGQPDLYPFVLSPCVIDKLGYREFDPCRVKTRSLGAWREPDCVQSYSAETYSPSIGIDG
jgi:hypothetical protein